MRSAKSGQYPLGAVVVSGGKILSRASTTLHKVPDPSAHAEMNAIREAAKKIRSRYLPGAWLYTTQEPCPMCTSVAIWAKMSGIVYGANMRDALRIFKEQKDKKFTWRQMKISSRYVVSRGTPKLLLEPNFMRPKCWALYRLSK